MHGQVIGITTAIKSSTGGSQGVGLAITSKLAKEIMDQLTQHGIVRRGYLGVQIKDLEPEIAVRLGVESQKGVLVARVMDGTPASKAGIQAGDVITTIGGKAVTTVSELQGVVTHMPIGNQTEVALVREGKAKSFKLTIDEMPRDQLPAALRNPIRLGKRRVLSRSTNSESN